MGEAVRPLQSSLLIHTPVFHALPPDLFMSTTPEGVKSGGGGGPRQHFRRVSSPRPISSATPTTTPTTVPAMAPSLSSEKKEDGDGDGLAGDGGREGGAGGVDGGVGGEGGM